MHAAARKIETAANIAIILVALVAGSVLIKRHFLAGPPHSAEPTPAPGKQPIVGTRLNLEGVDWTKSKQTLLLALSKGCHFCSESAPFYRKLAEEASGRRDVRLIAVFHRETDSEAKEYLDQLGVAIAEIQHAPPDAIGARGTPALVLADGAGRVVDSWIGRLPGEKEGEVLSRFKCEECE
jgi:hypothetical protein